MVWCCTPTALTLNLSSPPKYLSVTSAFLKCRSLLIHAIILRGKRSSCTMHLKRCGLWSSIGLWNRKYHISGFEFFLLPNRIHTHPNCPFDHEVVSILNEVTQVCQP